VSASEQAVRLRRVCCADSSSRHVHWWLQGASCHTTCAAAGGCAPWTCLSNTLMLCQPTLRVCNSQDVRRMCVDRAGDSCNRLLPCCTLRDNRTSCVHCQCRALLSPPEPAPWAVLTADARGVVRGLTCVGAQRRVCGMNEPLPCGLTASRPACTDDAHHAAPASSCCITH
jgi:hypothetical protein